jgi:hypothetical protein
MASESAAPSLPAVPPEGPGPELLEWVRRAPLVYGHWRGWKQLFKRLDTAALDGRVEDPQVLAAILWRADVLVPPARPHRWKKVENATEWRNYDRVAEARSVTHRFRVGANNNVSYKCWEVRVSPLSAPLQNNKPRPEDEVTWRCYGQDYNSGFKNAKVEGGRLKFEGQYRGRFEVDISDHSFLHIVDDGPSQATWGYVKRRARRLMRKLHRQNPALFWQMLNLYTRENAAVDGGTDRGTDAHAQPLPIAWAWLGDDLFFGRSPRLVQERRGRGPVKITGRFFWRRARLERAPEVWDAHRDGVRALLHDPATLPEAGAVAFNVLREQSGEAELAASLPAPVLARWAAGAVPWARSVALNEVARRWEQSPREVPDGTLAAQLLVEAGARTRRRAQVLVGRALADPASADAAWKRAFAKPLVEHLDAAVGEDTAQWTRRARSASSALFFLVREAISDTAFWKYLPLWARLSREAGRAGQSWIEDHVLRAAREGNLARLADLARLDEADRDALAEVFVRGSAGATIEPKRAGDMMMAANAGTVRLMWRLIEASGIGPSAIRTLFEALYNRYYGDAEQGAAIFGDEAARVWARGEWTEKHMRSWTEGSGGGYNVWRSPWVRALPHASAAFFLAVLDAIAARLANVEGSHATVRARYALRGAAVLPTPSQQAVVQAAADALRAFEPTEEDIRLAFTQASYYVRVKSYTGAWQALALTRVSRDLLAANWDTLFSLPIEREATAAAIELWKRADIDASLVSPWLQARAIASLSPDFLAFLLRRHPSLLLETLARAGDDQVRALQVLVRDQLRDDSFRQGFWDDLFPRLRDEALRPVIQARLLSDPEIFASFAALPASKAADFFFSGRDEAEDLLLSWLDAHLESLGRDDLALLHTAISPLPAVHTRGLQRLEVLGLSLPLALRLWESLLPPAIEAARRFVMSAAPGSEEERESILALCDSPSLPVQAQGRAILEERPHLLQGDLLARLSENTQPAMQAWVAKLLNGREAAAGAGADRNTREFDRVVLRGRGRARAAKEAVKERLARTDLAAEPGAVDAGVLLEMARGRGARDREWALQQIARLKMTGVDVPGVQIDGHS